MAIEPKKEHKEVSKGGGPPTPIHAWGAEQKSASISPPGGSSLKCAGTEVVGGKSFGSFAAAPQKCEGGDMTCSQSFDSSRAAGHAPSPGSASSSKHSSEKRAAVSCHGEIVWDAVAPKESMQISYGGAQWDVQRAGYCFRTRVFEISRDDRSSGRKIIQTVINQKIQKVKKIKHRG